MINSCARNLFIPCFLRSGAPCLQVRRIRNDNMTAHIIRNSQHNKRLWLGIRTEFRLCLEETFFLGGGGISLENIMWNSNWTTRWICLLQSCTPYLQSFLWKWKKNGFWRIQAVCWNSKLAIWRQWRFRKALALTQGSTNFSSKSKSHFKDLDGRRVTWSVFSAEDPEISGAALKNLVA